MVAWTCPECGRQFGRNKQSHECSPAMTLEEFHFRAFLQRRFGAVPASILFLLAHAGYGEPFFFVGLLAITSVLAIAFHRTGSVVAPMLAHGTFDAVQLFIFLPAALKFLQGG